ncbi:MAG TPA: hypothetical protein VK273_05655, partial [Gaiellaceae bacterium]|nr:hypothetical protein [Gaiellaceae bacterium]
HQTAETGNEVFPPVSWRAQAALGESVAVGQKPKLPLRTVRAIRDHVGIYVRLFLVVNYERDPALRGLRATRTFLTAHNKHFVSRPLFRQTLLAAPTQLAVI